jgi:hypothetical protein
MISPPMPLAVSIRVSSSSRRGKFASSLCTGMRKLTVVCAGPMVRCPRIASLSAKMMSG